MQNLEGWGGDLGRRGRRPKDPVICSVFCKCSFIIMFYPLTSLILSWSPCWWNLRLKLGPPGHTQGLSFMVQLPCV